MRLHSVTFETMLDELGQQQRENPSWGIAVATAPSIQATMLGRDAQARTVIAGTAMAPKDPRVTVSPRFPR